MKKIFAVAVLGALILPLSAYTSHPPTAVGFSLTAGTLPSAGLTPESPFYFLDEFTEILQEFFTFDREGKVRLQVGFTAERASELRVMLGKDQPNVQAVMAALERIETHRLRAAHILRGLPTDDPRIAALATETVSEFDILDDILGEVLDAGSDRLIPVIVTEERALEQKLTDATFSAALGEVLERIAAEINAEVGSPLEGFVLVEEEFNVDIDGDTYSATYRAEANEVVDLVVLRDRILLRATGWESKDVVLADDSLDITLEKEYAPAVIDGITLYPEASVTVSATTNSPRSGMTEMNYDVDITLRTESERFIDLLEEEKSKIEDALEEVDEEAERRLEGEESALRAIEGAQREKQGIIDDAAKEDIAVPANSFSTFDDLLIQANSALALGNYEEAKRLADDAEASLEAVEKTMRDLEKAKAREEELMREREEREMQEVERREADRVEGADEAPAAEETGAYDEAQSPEREGAY
jgi:hypothetical protein